MTSSGPLCPKHPQFVWPVRSPSSQWRLPAIRGKWFALIFCTWRTAGYKKSRVGQSHANGDAHTSPTQLISSVTGNCPIKWHRMKLKNSPVKAFIRNANSWLICISRILVGNWDFHLDLTNLATLLRAAQRRSKLWEVNKIMNQRDWKVGKGSGPDNVNAQGTITAAEDKWWTLWKLKPIKLSFSSIQA